MKFPQCEVDSRPAQEILFVSGGRVPSREFFLNVAGGRKIFCIDKGIELCRACGVVPDFLIGDFDSADKNSVDWARAKNISVGNLEDTGAVISARGRVRLTDRDEIPALDDNRQLNKDWTKTLVESNCAWLWVQSLVKVFSKAGIAGCAELLTHFDGDTESLKNLAYRLYNICEKKNWAREGTGYNELVVEWQDILSRRAEFMQNKKPAQGKLF